MQAKRVRSHDRANANVSVAKEHALEEVRPWKIPSHRVTARDFEAIERLMLGGRGQGSMACGARMPRQRLPNSD